TRSPSSHPLHQVYKIRGRTSLRSSGGGPSEASFHCCRGPRDHARRAKLLDRCRDQRPAHARRHHWQLHQPLHAKHRHAVRRSGDPEIACDNHGSAFFGSESSDDPAGTKKTFGDVWVATFDNPQGETGASLNDGKRFVGSEVIARGSSAPNLLGKFNDKTAIEADRSGSNCDANVYFAYSRFTGNGGVAIYFSRSTDHGASWSSPKKLSSATDVQFPDISVTGNGNV